MRQAGNCKVTEVLIRLRNPVFVCQVSGGVPVCSLQHAVDVLCDEPAPARVVPPLHLLLKWPHLTT